MAGMLAIDAPPMGQIIHNERGRYAIFPSSIELSPADDPSRVDLDEPGARLEPKKIIICQYSEQVTEGMLRGMLNKYGFMEEFRIGSPKNYAFATFVSQVSADKAVLELDGVSLFGKPLKVMHARVQEDTSRTTLHLGGVPTQWTVEDLHEYFQSFGKVTSVKILLDPESGISRGVGFVTFASRKTAETAQSLLNGVVSPDAETNPESMWKAVFTHGGARGRNLKRRRHLNSEAADEPVSAPAVMVGSKLNKFAATSTGSVNPTGSADVKTSIRAFPIEVSNTVASETVAVLTTMFDRYGTVVGIEIVAKGDATGGGRAVISFESAEQAWEAVEEMNGYQHLSGRKFRVEIQPANRRK